MSMKDDNDFKIEVEKAILKGFFISNDDFERYHNIYVNEIKKHDKYMGVTNIIANILIGLFLFFMLFFSIFICYYILKFLTVNAII